MPVTEKRPAQQDSKMLGGKKVHTVRGGGICAKGDKPALNRDTMQTMLCIATPGRDPRPRWSTPGAGSSQGTQGTRGSRGSHAHATTAAGNPKNRVTQRRS
jgi:hypothetical protein